MLWLVSDQLSWIEATLGAFFGWPSWACRIILVLLWLVCSTSAVQTIFQPEKLVLSGKAKKETYTKDFRIFQAQYLVVYLTIMLADWLQGTNMYTLYSSYGVNVGSLFLTGFLSSAVFGTFLGIYVDSYGRKLGCVVFCALEIIINILEHVPIMNVLLFGRILGGLSTSLLFTAFESWMVSEHRRRGFKEEWLSSTFGIASWGNGIVAIVAGLLAQTASDIAGDIGPFQLAIILTVLCLIPISLWHENYGGGSSEGEEPSSGGNGRSDNNSPMSFLRQSMAAMRKKPSILLLGLSQACFEGAMYTFVFMWVPSLMIANAKHNGSSALLPTGLVFSAFMLSMTLGGMLFSLLLPVFSGGAEVMCMFVYLISAAAMLVPVISFEFWPVVISFLVLEAMVGVFNSCGGMLRSHYYPEEVQSSVMSVFRVPLNLLVVVGTRLTDRANEVPSLQFVFACVAAMHGAALLLQLALFVGVGKSLQPTSTKTKKKEKKM